MSVVWPYVVAAGAVVLWALLDVCESRRRMRELEAERKRRIETGPDRP